MDMLNTVLTPVPWLRTVVTDDSLIIVDQKSGLYFGLSGVGVRIWELLAERNTYEQLVPILTAEYEAEKDQIAEDAMRLLNKLYESKLIQEADRSDARVSL